MSVLIFPLQYFDGKVGELLAELPRQVPPDRYAHVFASMYPRQYKRVSSNVTEINTLKFRIKSDYNIDFLLNSLRCTLHFIK